MKKPEESVAAEMPMRSTLMQVAAPNGGFRTHSASFHERHRFNLALAISEGWVDYQEPRKLRITRDGREELFLLGRDR